jgi:hypothetical protein
MPSAPTSSKLPVAALEEVSEIVVTILTPFVEDAGVKLTAVVVAAS